LARILQAQSGTGNLISSAGGPLYTAHLFLESEALDSAQIASIVQQCLT